MGCALNILKSSKFYFKVYKKPTMQQPRVNHIIHIQGWGEFHLFRRYSMICLPARWQILPFTLTMDMRSSWFRIHMPANITTISLISLVGHALEIDRGNKSQVIHLFFYIRSIYLWGSENFGIYKLIEASLKTSMKNDLLDLLTGKILPIIFCIDYRQAREITCWWACEEKLPATSIISVRNLKTLLLHLYTSFSSGSQQMKLSANVNSCGWVHRTS